MQKEIQNRLYRVLDGYIPDADLRRKNKAKSWEYGYDEKYDIIIISHTGQVGEVYEIDGLVIGLPLQPKKIYSRSRKKSEQYWERTPLPDQLKRIRTIFQWNKTPDQFKSKWIDYIEQEFERREEGFWFMNKGVPTYITGSNYMYVHWSRIDVGYPDYREANRILFIHWEACKADYRSFGQCYLKIRRSGFSFMSSSESINTATIRKKARVGILSKTGADAKKMFTDKVVPMNSSLPFFFLPIMDGMDKPKTELAYRVPASKITKNNMYDDPELIDEGLDTTIDWKNTAENSYDSEKLQLLIHDECYAPETLIMNDQMNFVPIADINVGDEVTVDGGDIKRVVKKTYGIADRYLIKQPYGEDYIVTENHRLVLHDYYKGEVILTAKEFFESSKFRKQHLTRIVSKGVDREDIFDGIPPYLLGLWLGDGRKSCMTIIINQDEEPEIVHYLGMLCLNHKLEFSIKKRKECKPHVIEFRIKGMRGELRKIGVLNNKHVPEQYLKSSIDTRLQILAGLIDTDGYSSQKKGSIRFGQADKNLVEQIRYIALSCGLSCSPVRHKISNFNTDVYMVSISGNLSEIPILTEKKSFAGYSPCSRGRRNKVDIEYLGPGDYVGIQVNGSNDDERKLILHDFTVSLNSGKWERPNNIKKAWQTQKTCLRLGRKIIGKCMMGSTVNALSKGGDNFKKIYDDSRVETRNKNGRTKSGLYSLFIPMEFNTEGFIDKYGMPVIDTPEKPVEGIDGEMIKQGAVDFWQAEVDSLKSDADALNEFYRQNPRTESHAFRDESKQSIFNLTKIYQQIDYNDAVIDDHYITRGKFIWRDGVKDSQVIWVPDRKGDFYTSWIPPKQLQNKVIKKGSRKLPGNEHLGAFGCDSYDISGTVKGSGSKGSLHGLTKYNMDYAPVNEFFLEYIARPQTAEMFFENVLMAIVFYGMPILAENNKPRLLYHLKNRGYRGYSINRPDKVYNKLSKTEKELGGIPNTSEAVKQAHASAIESYIEKYIGYDVEGIFRDPDEIGTMPFNKTLHDWSKFDISNRTKHDASISTGLAIMACQKHLYQPEKKESKIKLNFATYNNRGIQSELIE